MIGLLGLDYRSADMEVRGRLTFAGDRLSSALTALAREPAIDEAAIVSTCHRTEIYVAGDDLSAARAVIKRFLAAAHALDPSAAVASVPLMDAPAPALPASVTQGLYELEGDDAVRHLFSVAAGLRSMVVGEAQILGQVKEALGAAEQASTAGEELRSLFATAIRVGKRARAETEIGRADASVASLAMRVADESLGGLAGKTVLLIGAGRTSQLCAQLAQAAGSARIVLANRSAATAAELAAEVGGVTIPLHEIGQVIADVHLIVSATAAPHTVLGASAVAAATPGRAAPLVVIDLAVPADVEQQVGQLPGVVLHTLDTLREVGPAAGEEPAWPRAADVACAEVIVEDGVRELARARALRLAVPGIAALRRHVDRSERAELARALGRLKHLSPEDQATVERFGQRLVDQMFHHLVSRIRSLAEDDGVSPEVTMRVLARLFADPDVGAESSTDAAETANGAGTVESAAARRGGSQDV
jgi:glutamyl-tRNA reductase